jgi:hypothetical protein
MMTHRIEMTIAALQCACIAAAAVDWFLICMLAVGGWL